jgi:hypothetical protein
LLNDGAAIVFFAIFKDIYFHGIGIEGFGREIDVAEGVKVRHNVLSGRVIDSSMGIKRTQQLSC